MELPVPHTAGILYPGYSAEDDYPTLERLLGGGVRQGGVLAAAGLVALERIDSLAEDHRNAALLAEGDQRVDPVAELLEELGWDTRCRVYERYRDYLESLEK